VTFFRQMGGTLGTAVFLSVLLTALPGKIADAFRSVQGTPQFQDALAAHPDQAATLQAAAQGNTDLNDTSFISRLDPVIAHPFKVGFSDATTLVFLMGAVIMVIGFIAVLLLPEIPLADRSAAQARAAEDADAAGAGAPPVAVASLAEANPAPTGPAATLAAEPGPNGRAGAEPDGQSMLDPDGDQRGRHNADGHEGELRVPADGHAGGGRHEADGPPGPLDGAGGDPAAADAADEAPESTARPTAGS
jgi:hypothetical protein